MPRAIFLFAFVFAALVAAGTATTPITFWSNKDWRVVSLPLEPTAQEMAIISRLERLRFSGYRIESLAERDVLRSIHEYMNRIDPNGAAFAFVISNETEAKLTQLVTLDTSVLTPMGALFYLKAGNKKLRFHLKDDRITVFLSDKPERRPVSAADMLQEAPRIEADAFAPVPLTLRGAPDDSALLPR